MNLIPTFKWLAKPFTTDNLDIVEWIKEGLVPTKYYRKGLGWFEDYKTSVVNG